MDATPSKPTGMYLRRLPENHPNHNIPSGCKIQRSQFAFYLGAYSMKQKTKKIISGAMATALSLGVAAVSTQVVAKSNCPVEKCYGIVKKAKNDCGTSKHACAAQSKINGDKNDWMFVMKGNCDRIVGGSLTPPKVEAKATAKKKGK